jgi:hypothetical protein
MRRLHRIAATTGILVFIGLMLISPARASGSSFINEAFAPLRNVDIAGLYDEHSFFFDLLIYIVAFIGIVRVTLGKRFQGWGSNLLISSIGVILALSLALAGKSMGFTIKSFSPLAAFILILIVGISAYQIIRTAGFDFAGSGALAFILVYFIIRALTPGVFEWADKNFPWIHLILLIAVIFAAWDIIRKFSSHGKETAITQMSQIARKNQPAEKEMERDIDEGIKEEIAVTEKQVHTLQDIIHKIDGGFKTDEERLYIIRLLDVIKARKAEEFKVIWKIRNFIKKIEGFTEAEFHQMQKKCREMPENARKGVMSELFMERKKEAYLKNMEKELALIESRQKSFIGFLDKAQEFLKGKQIDTAKAALHQAVKMEMDMAEHLKNIKELGALMTHFHV